MSVETLGCARVVILLTGSELTEGTTRDANGPFLAAELHRLGFSVDEMLLVPDRPEVLRRTFLRASEVADVVLISGGLGPTSDDHTVAVLAAAFGREVVRDPAAEERMRGRAVRRYGSEARIPANFFKQAEIVDGAQVIRNANGLAPGCWFVANDALIATLPGVPHELRTMFMNEVLPLLRDRFQLDPPRILRARVLGHSESALEQRVQAIGIADGLDYGISARAGEILIKLIAHRVADHPLLDRFRQRLVEELGDDVIVAAEGGPAEVDFMEIVHDRLLAAGVTVGSAESCTGGLIGKRLTDHPGSSAYYRGTIVAYHDDLKRSLLGVSSEVLAEHGAVSSPVCAAMAIGARHALGADYVLATTGIAGPGGGSDDKPVGLVYIGIAGPGSDEPRVKRMEGVGDRVHVRDQTAIRALDLLRRELSSR